MTVWPGRLLVISSPSGGGKTTVIKRILEKKYPNIIYSVSFTTRPRRLDEIDGIDYFFISVDDFKQKIDNGEFVEWEEVHGNYYGTSKVYIENWLHDGKTILMDIDVKGALEIRKHYPEHSSLIFLKPPSMNALEERLAHRGSDGHNEINKRLQAAEQEISVADQFDHIVINDELEITVEKVWSIINSILNE